MELYNSGRKEEVNMQKMFLILHVLRNFIFLNVSTLRMCYNYIFSPPSSPLLL
jgi:hypothetical protein